MRYSRQQGLVDQEKLKRASIGVFGLGGLGNAIVAYLAAAGIGKLVIVDGDTVEESNLNRQILFKPSDIGKKKIDVVEAWVKEFNPEIKVAKFEQIDSKAIEKCDIVVDALDNWESRRKLWEIAFAKNKPIVHGAADEWYGQVAVLLNKKDAEAIKGKGKGSRIIGATTGIIGSLMAYETIKFVQNPPSSSYFITFDGNEMRRFRIKGEVWNCIIAKPDEVWIKSKVTKAKMMRKLLQQVKGRVSGRVYSQGPVIFVEPYSRGDLEKLLKIFGIKVVSPALKVSLEKLEEEFKKIAKEFLPGKKFRISAKRIWKGYEKSSIEIQRWLGEVALKTTDAKVDLKNYDVEIFVEVHRDFALLYMQRYRGAGGLPYGSEGKAILLFSGGIDSPVAAYLLAKRGVALDLLFLNPLGQVLESQVYGVYEVLKEYVPANLYVIDTSKLVEEIRKKVREGYRQVVLKRFMYRIAERVAEKVGAEAIATGESLGQASSQTLANLAIIERAVNIPVLRPLLGMDKDEITKIAREIGTYEKSSRIAEFCSLEEHSNARASEEKVLVEERKMNIDLDAIVKTLREAKREEIDDIEPSKADLEDAVVVKLWEEIPKLEKGKKYIFVCYNGNRAREEAYRARKKGIEAFALSYKEARKMGLL